MYKILILTFIVSILNANNPKIYSALGDVIYNNAEKIKKLEELEVYEIYKDEISQYIQKVNKTRELGFEIEALQKSEEKKGYLESLRELSKQNDFFQRSVEINYKQSIENEDSVLFSHLINSGLIDTQANKEEILDYYFSHVQEINTTGVIQIFLDKDEKLKERKDAKALQYKTRQMKETEKIKRIRENDIKVQKQLEKRLQEEVSKKKQEIRKIQQKELTQ